MKNFIRYRISFCETGEVAEREYFGKNPIRSIKKHCAVMGFDINDENVIVEILSKRTVEEELKYSLAQLKLFVGRNDLETVNHRAHLYSRISDCMYMLRMHNIPFEEKLYL